ncbi:MAG: ParB N-terminal domain-containing protein [Phycisphaeraceae bacterium]
MQWIALAQLRSHPMNANAMPDPLYQKLVANIRRTGRYPPLIVRPMPPGADNENDPDGQPCYQVLDGHHRWKAIAQLEHERAACMVWEVDDAEATLLLTTLNRLSGRDDPKRRAALLADLHERHGRSVEQLADLLPETREQVQRWLAVQSRLPEPRQPQPLEQMPAAVHFFLSGKQKTQLDATLAAIGGRRETALMQVIEAHTATIEKENH